MIVASEIIIFVQKETLVILLIILHFTHDIKNMYFHQALTVFMISYPAKNDEKKPLKIYFEESERSKTHFSSNLNHHMQSFQFRDVAFAFRR